MEMDDRIIVIGFNDKFTGRRHAILIVIIGLCVFCHDASASKKKWHFAFGYIKRALTINPLPIQQAQINTAFYFPLESFVTVLKPEVNFLVTNLAKWPTESMSFHYLPTGLIFNSAWPDTCTNLRPLQPGTSCVLHFEIDKRQYGPHPDCGPHFSHYDYEYYLCNSFNAVANAAVATQITVTPAAQDGLRYDAATRAIVGVPTRVGEYTFTIGAINGVDAAQPKPLTIHVQYNSQETPIFKPRHNLIAAMPNHLYRLQLLDLIDKKPSFGVTNQIHFRIDQNHTHNYPDWIQLDTTSGTVIEGKPPVSDVGQVKELSVIASSNTGGDSAPLLIRIPVTYDPSKKPHMKTGLEFRSEAGALFRQALSPFVTDRDENNNLNIILDKASPEAPWLSISPLYELEGVVPVEAVGRSYEVTLRASTPSGGSSDPVTVLLHIHTNPDLTPTISVSAARLPLMHAGQPYLFDFTTYEGIFPGYDAFPYRVELADGEENPSWLRIEDNRLIADEVRFDPLHPFPILHLTIQNTPGGISKPIAVLLLIDKAIQ